MVSRVRVFVCVLCMILLGQIGRASQLSTPLTSSSTMGKNDTVVSPSVYVQLSFDTAYMILRMDWIGPGSPYYIWDSGSDAYFTSGYGSHVSQSNYDTDGYAVMQGDGNFGSYDGSSSALWATNTNGNSGSRLEVQDDTNLVVYNASNAPIWSLF
jgi:hypothetical protein